MAGAFVVGAPSRTELLDTVAVALVADPSSDVHDATPKPSEPTRAAVHTDLAMKCVVCVRVRTIAPTFPSFSVGIPEARCRPQVAR